MNDTITQIHTGSFTTVFLIRGRAGCVLVDTSFPGRAERVLDSLSRHGVAPGDIHLILITHGHTDHFGSAAALRERTGAPVAIHTLDVEGPRQGTHVPGSLHPTGRLMGLLMRFPVLQSLLLSDVPPAFELDIAFDEEFRLDEYGVPGWVLLTPGHTPGSVSVLLDSGEAVVGDMVMGGLMGLVSKPGPPIVAWDLDRNWESVRELEALSPCAVYIGHGGPFRDLSSLAEEQ